MSADLTYEERLDLMDKRTLKAECLRLWSVIAGLEKTERNKSQLRRYKQRKRR